MEITKTSENEVCTINVTEKLSIYDAVALHHELISAFEVSQKVIFDWSQATSCDTAVMQLLLSSIKTAEKNEVDFSVTRPCDEIIKFSRNIGIDLEKIVKIN